MGAKLGDDCSQNGITSEDTTTAASSAREAGSKDGYDVSPDSDEDDACGSQSDDVPKERVRNQDQSATPPSPTGCAQCEEEQEAEVSYADSFAEASYEESFASDVFEEE